MRETVRGTQEVRARTEYSVDAYEARRRKQAIAEHLTHGMGKAEPLGRAHIRSKVRWT